MGGWTQYVNTQIHRYTEQAGEMGLYKEIGESRMRGGGRHRSNKVMPHSCQQKHTQGS